MRINSISPYNNFQKNNNPTFKAEVMIGKWDLTGDKHKTEHLRNLSNIAEETKKELERLYPSNKDNIKIVLNPCSNNNFYGLDYSIGYVKSEDARDYILKNHTKFKAEYPLDSETIDELQKRDKHLMEQLKRPLNGGTIPYPSPYFENTIQSEIIRQIRYLMDDDNLHGDILFQRPDPPPKEPEPPDNRTWYDKVADFVMKPPWLID